jgi:molecular chaperone DnaJ
MSKNFYDILGVSKTASDDEIKKAYRNLSKKYHPDLQHGKSDAEKKDIENKFKEINEAYSVLGDSEKKQQYDNFGTTDFSGGGAGGFDPREFFRGHFPGGFNFDFGGGFDFDFGQGHHHNDPNRPQNGDDIRIGVEISFDEAIFGTTRKFNVRKNAPCEKCGGTGAKDKKFKTCPKCDGKGVLIYRKGNFISQTTCPECMGSGNFPEEKCSECNGSGLKTISSPVEISIPSGICDGETLVVRGGGHLGRNGGTSGDLYIIVHTVNDNGLYARSGYHGEHIHVCTYIPTAFVGVVDELDIPTPYGPKKIKIPTKLNKAGNYDVKITGAGVKRKNGPTGDLHIHIVPVPITNLTDEQKKITQSLIDSLKPENIKMVKDYEKNVETNNKIFEKYNKSN